MSSTSEIASAVVGMAAGAFGIWVLVQIVNDRRKSKIAVTAAVVGSCLWLPFSWLMLMSGGWSDYRVSWLKMWPFLPGLVPGAYFFHASSEALEFLTMAVSTLVLSSTLIWIGCRGWKWLVGAALVALLTSIPTACIAYALYCF